MEPEPEAVYMQRAPIAAPSDGSPMVGPAEARPALNQLLSEIGALSSSLAARAEVARALRDEHSELLSHLKSVHASTLCPPNAFRLLPPLSPVHVSLPFSFSLSPSPSLCVRVCVCACVCVRIS